MTTTTNTTTSQIIASGLRRVIGYAELLVKDIPAEKFAHMPHPNMNHPAFCLGHLSMYPNRFLEMLGRQDLIAEKDGWSELFDAPAKCVDGIDQYPTKDEIVSHFIQRHNALVEGLSNVDDATLQKENPMQGRMKELFPTIGVAVNFTANAHTMLHLGQISAWRRAVGLGPVM